VGVDRGDGGKGWEAGAPRREAMAPTRERGVGEGDVGGERESGARRRAALHWGLAAARPCAGSSPPGGGVHVWTPAGEVEGEGKRERKKEKRKK